jgi:hypothetical protein
MASPDVAERAQEIFARHLLSHARRITAPQQRISNGLAAARMVEPFHVERTILFGAATPAATRCRVNSSNCASASGVVSETIERGVTSDSGIAGDEVVQQT